MADDWARWSGEYHLSTGRSLAEQPVHVLYDVAAAWLARDAERPEVVREAIDGTLDNIDPPEKIEQVRRDDGLLEYDPDMVIDDWGYTDPEEMNLDMPPASATFAPGGGPADSGEFIFD